MAFSSSRDGEREEDREFSSNSQSASAFSIPGSSSKSDWAGSKENNLDEDIKQYTRIQILTLENIQPAPQAQRKIQKRGFWRYVPRVEAGDAKSAPLVPRRVNLKPSPSPDYLPPPESSPIPHGPARRYKGERFPRLRGERLTRLRATTNHRLQQEAQAQRELHQQQQAQLTQQQKLLQQ